MKHFNLFTSVCLSAVLFSACQTDQGNNYPMERIHQYAMKAPKDVETRWASAENP